MKEILETTHLEFDKSAFLIDLVKHKSGQLYIEISQTINNEKTGAQLIKLNPSVLYDIIKVLQYYQSKIPSKSESSIKYFNNEDQQKILKRYLKGIPMKELAIQFDVSFELIEMILKNNDIHVMPEKKPKQKRSRKRKRKY